MSYRVRTADGELRFGDRADLETAWRQGLIAPDDELFDERSKAWIRAAAAHELSNVPQRRPRTIPRELRWASIAVILAAGSLWYYLSGRLTLAIVTALIVSALTSILAYKATRRR